MKKLEAFFERILWNSRLLVLIAVMASIVMSICMFFVATVDTIDVVGRLTSYGVSLDNDARLLAREEIVAHIVKGIDGYLIAIIILVFGLGLYELFIDRIDVAEGTKFSRNILQVSSLDDLKQRLARLIMLILMVEFFKAALEVRFNNSIELLYFAGGIALIAAAIFLSHPRNGEHK